jgi:hypothetical protein
MATKRGTIHRIPSARQFLPAINAKDRFKRVIRTHQLIEKALIRGIAKRLFRPDALDMAAMPFPLKVSLAIALGVIPADYGPPLLKVNAIRNMFAHNPSAKLMPEKAADLWNCVPPPVQESLKGIFKRKFSMKPNSVINMVFGVMFIDLKRFAGRKLARIAAAPDISQS